MKEYIIIMLIICAFMLSLDLNAEIKFGTELDALPFATGGYYLSAFAGFDNIRFRTVLSQVNIPQFVVQDGFDENSLIAYTFLIDYFLNSKKEMSGFWIGGGYELWKSEIRNNENKIKKEYSNNVATFGAGYTFTLYKNIYLNPWGAGHLLLDKDIEFPVGGTNLELKRFSYEASLKVGIIF